MNLILSSKLVSYIAISSFCILLISGCGSLPTSSEPQTLSVEPSNIKTPSQLEEEALATRDGTRASKLLDAAQSWYHNDAPQRASYLLKQIDTNQLDNTQLFKLSTLLGAIYSEQGRYQLALDALNIALTGPTGNDLTKAEPVTQAMLIAITEWRHTRVTAFSRMERHWEAAYDAYQLSQFLTNQNQSENITNTPEYHHTLNIFWQQISLLTPEKIGHEKAQTGDLILFGWLELAEISASNISGIERQYQALSNWLKINPFHPANNALPQNLSLLKSMAQNKPQRITLILPLSGQLQKAGDAILQGFMATYLNNRNRGTYVPELEVLDENKFSANELAQMLSIRDSEEEKQVFLGPLEKNKAQRLSEIYRGTSPLLVMNSIQSTNNRGPLIETGASNLPSPETISGTEQNIQVSNNEFNNIFGISLGIEAEAAQVAGHAFKKGHQRAAIIVPDSEWGVRAAEAFGQEWRQQGGQVVTQLNYGENTTHAESFAQTLHISKSESRKQNIQRLLGKNIEFQARRRQDIEFIFLAASPNQARQIKPMLAFYYASKIPVYSTSSIYSGTVNTKRDRDLNGVEFNTMPWIMDDYTSRKVLATNNDNIPALEKLYALGRDSFYLHERLEQFIYAPDTTYQGATGMLHLPAEQQANNFARKQVWAIFKAGKPILINE